MLPGASILLFHDGTNWKMALASLADALPVVVGTAGQVLQSGGAGAPMAWAAGGGGGGLIPVSSETFGAVANATVSGIDSTARIWVLVFTRLQPVIDNARLQCEFRLGGSFPADNKYEHHTDISVSGVGPTFATVTGQAVIDFTNGIGQTNLAGLWGDLTFIITSPAVTDQRKMVRYKGHIGTVTTPHIRTIDGHAVHIDSDAALDAIRLKYNAGNIASGLVADLYKYDTP